MAASNIIPLTVTYSTGGALSTVTVLGQVLNNGATNWIPTGTSDNAIVLETSSADGEASTVLNGQTYYITTGPALPDQATGVTITPSSLPSSLTATGFATSSMPHGSKGSSSSAFQMTTPTMSASSSSGSSKSSSGSKGSGAGRTVELTGSMGVIVAGLVLSSIIGAFAL